METNLKKKIIDIVKEVMDIDLQTIDPQSRINTLRNWDSFNNLMLISRFQDEFNVEFTAVEIENVQKIHDLFELLERKASSRKG